MGRSKTMFWALGIAIYLILEACLPARYQPSAWVLRGAIRVYQFMVSPIILTRCRFQPSCSQYGLEALRRYGTLKGGALTTWRVLRCNPFCKGGDDPVP